MPKNESKSKVNLEALKPLYNPWEQPDKHRKRNPEAGGPALIIPGRRPSVRCHLVRSIRMEVDQWRRGGYMGASETTKTLLNYWFEGEHRIRDADGGYWPFKYYWAQREAVETIIYLHEIRKIPNVAELMFEYGDDSIKDLALGINPDEDRWLKACCKIATGGGKTKVMSLAIVWSYFNGIKENNCTFPRHFVIIAPNLTVYERLKDDFENCAIFYKDPLIPEEWKSEFQVQVVLQDDPGGSSSTGTIYLTNIHRLYAEREGGDEDAEGAASIFGPKVSRAKALDTGEDLRRRIASHPSVMVLNDEAHHLHDPELAWNKAIDNLYELNKSFGGKGIGLQLDFSATPKHNDGTLFKHIICDFPLGEAVDAGIVKVPIIGESEELQVRGRPSDPANERYAIYLKLGYERYKEKYEELSQTRKPILFVMTEDAKAADDIAKYLNGDGFPLLKGRVLNIHTRLTGKIKTVKRGGAQVKEFIESESKMKPDDLRELREMSRQLDSPNSEFRCVVSVLMLREGWDIKNVTTIVPLRPYSADSRILPEQTLGRGLRRMFPGSGMPETVTVIEHPAFKQLYKDELEQEGLDIAFLPIRESLKETVSIFVDYKNKKVEELELEIPRVSESLETVAEFEEIKIAEVKKYFLEKHRQLPIGRKKDDSIDYKESHLFTQETISQAKLDFGLLQNAYSAVNYFVRLIGDECHIPNPHKILAPLIEEFLSKVLFEREVNLYSGEVDHRMRDSDVIEHVKAAFVPLIKNRIIKKTDRKRISKGVRLSTWKPFQATSTAGRPAVAANKTMFNLVSCHGDFEQQFVDFFEHADDVAAFAKNAGPEKLTIDYLKSNRQISFYWPDFIVRTTDGNYVLLETKGKPDIDVPRKAQAAKEWCKAASTSKIKWDYVYVTYNQFHNAAVSNLADLKRAAEPSLVALLDELKGAPELPMFETIGQKEENILFNQIIKEAGIKVVPQALEPLMRQAVQTLDFTIRSKMPSFASAFQTLLAPFDDYSIRILESKLVKCLPHDNSRRHEYFYPVMPTFISFKDKNLLEKHERYLEQNLSYGRSINRLGTLLFCLDFANNWKYQFDYGVWRDVKRLFSGADLNALYKELNSVNNFRNTRVAHVEETLINEREAWDALKVWLRCLNILINLA